LIYFSYSHLHSYLLFQSHLSSFTLYLPHFSSFHTCRCLLLDTYILYSSIFCSLLFLSTFPQSSTPNIPFLLYLPIFILYVSVFTYSHLYSRLIFPKLTPHVLSEWMVEVCGRYLCGIHFMFGAYPVPGLAVEVVGIVVF
jgi:hypothetical protein